MSENNKELRLIAFAFIFSLVIVLSTAFVGYPVIIINAAYGILVVSALLLIKNLLDRRKNNK